MSYFLNSKRGSILFSREASKISYVDKTALMEPLCAFLDDPSSASDCTYTCIIRPRRFGKTVAANMLAAFLGKGVDSRPVFDRLQVSSQAWYDRQINQHNVIFISMNDLPDEENGQKTTYASYLRRIRNRLMEDLLKEWPEAGIRSDDDLWTSLEKVTYSTGEQFVFIVDEWDYIFHKDFASVEEKQMYIEFLSNLFKDRVYVEAVWMEGIMPISKHCSGSELNMFLEYTMFSQQEYALQFGFTESETDLLYARYEDYYAKQNKQIRFSRQDLREWYDGYTTLTGEKIYNPRSVVSALNCNHIESYWTSSGPYDEIFTCVRNNVDAVREDMAKLVSGIPVRASVPDIRKFASVGTKMETREQILSAMLVFGFLTWEKGFLRIPNHELMLAFEDMLREQPEMGYVNRLAASSERMLKATLAGRTDIMEEILTYAHASESSVLSFNDEADLTSLITLVYLGARTQYRLVRQEPSGTGFADFIFFPKDPAADSIILELKVDDTPEHAIDQIKDRRYYTQLTGKIAEKPYYTGRILLVGISYDRKDTSKRHFCRVEVFRESIRV